MSVKKYIAAFETHNDVVRGSPLSSPCRSPGSESAISAKGMDSFSFDPAQRDSDRGSEGSVRSSATGLASHARRNRLLKEFDKPISNETAESSRGSLAERRKARQMRKQNLMQKRSASKGRSEKRESRHTPPTNPPVRSQHRQQPESLSSSRRGMYDPNAESDEFDAAPQRTSISRFAQARRERRTVAQNNDGMTSSGDHDYDDTQYDTVDGTDDEVTLTSVRQIMTTPAVQPHYMKEGMKPHNVLRTASSSSIEDDTRLVMYKNVPRSTSLQRSRFMDDEDTLDYAALNEEEEGDIDDDKQSTNRQRHEKGTEIRRGEKGRAGHPGVSPLVTEDDMEHFRRTLDTPLMKTAAFVVGAATIGTMLLGPVGLLLGAATVGIGVGVMQIPDEQRTYMKDKATKTLEQAHESALNASETLSTSCAAACHSSGVGNQLPSEMKQCFTQDDLEADDDHHSVAQSAGELLEKGITRSVSGVNGGFAVDGSSLVTPSVLGRNRRVACLRDVRITPVDQIHGLQPQKQPRAWLDVLASANTTTDEKGEAMEEIKILSRDKRHARMLLDEGILDSLMYILNRFFDKVRRGTPIDANERFHAKLAASCCVTLGKAHCAAVHTEGDLLLMSMYERGTVPEERQLAQMLYDVPHHVLSKEPDVFALQQTSMPVAEELACKIKDLATS